MTSKSAFDGRFCSLGLGGTSLDAPDSQGPAANNAKAFRIIYNDHFLRRLC